MSNFFSVLAITAPIYLLIGLGFVSVRFRLFQAADLRVMGQFVLYLALPALLFSSLTARRLDEVFHLEYLAVYALSGLVLIVIAWPWARARRADDDPQHSASSRAAIRLMGMVCPNSGFVGFPIISMILPAIAPSVLAMNMLVENLITIPLLLTLAMPRAPQLSRRQFLLTALQGLVHNLMRNPLVIALGLALATMAAQESMGLHWPAPVLRSVQLVGAASSALSLFVIGGTLASQQQLTLSPSAMGVTFGKLVAQPITACLAIVLGIALGWSWGLPAPLNPANAASELAQFRQAVLLTVAMPTMGIYPLFAHRYGLERMAAQVNVATTLGSFFTLNALLWWLQSA